MGFLRTLLALSVVLDHLGGGTTDWLVWAAAWPCSFST